MEDQPSACFPISNYFEVGESTLLQIVEEQQRRGGAKYDTIHDIAKRLVVYSSKDVGDMDTSEQCMKDAVTDHTASGAFLHREGLQTGDAEMSTDSAFGGEPVGIDGRPNRGTNQEGPSTPFSDFST